MWVRQSFFFIFRWPYIWVLLPMIISTVCQIAEKLFKYMILCPQVEMLWFLSFHDQKTSLNINHTVFFVSLLRRAERCENCFKKNMYFFPAPEKKGQKPSNGIFRAKCKKPYNLKTSEIEMQLKWYPTMSNWVWIGVTN